MPLCGCVITSEAHSCRKGCNVCFLVSKHQCSCSRAACMAPGQSRRELQQRFVSTLSLAQYLQIIDCCLSGSSRTGMNRIWQPNSPVPTSLSQLCFPLTSGCSPSLPCCLLYDVGSAAWLLFLLLRVALGIHLSRRQLNSLQRQAAPSSTNSPINAARLDTPHPLQACCNQAQTDRPAATCGWLTRSGWSGCSFAAA